MSNELISIIVLVVVFLVATTMGINMGVLGVVAAFGLGTALGVSEDDIFAGFPGDLFVILVGVTLLFGIASNNGTVDWLIQAAVRAVKGRTVAIPWVFFLVTAILTASGAVVPGAVAIVAPIALGFAIQYGINPVSMGLFRDDDRARRFQVRGQRRFVGRDVSRKHQRPAGGRHVGGVDVVLERHRDAVERAAQLALRAFTIELVGLLERLRIDGQRRVQAILVHPDPHQVLLDQLAGGHLAFCHRRLHLRNRGLDDREPPLALDRERERCEHQDENEKATFHALYSNGNVR